MKSKLLPVLRFPLYFCFVAISVMSLTGCDMLRNDLKHDREGNKQFQDYRDALAPRIPEMAEAADAKTGDTIPDLQPYVAGPDSNQKAMPLVSISVNQSVSLRDVLFELAQQAEYDLELDPRITGSIIFTARDRPFDEVVARIADVAGLRYKFENDVLRVELDTPYNKTYKIDYLSYIRTNQGSIRNNIGVVSGEGTDTGSQYEAKSESESDFWGELEQNLDQLLGGTSSGALKTRSTPKISATDANPQTPQVAAVAPSSNEPGAQPNVQVQAPQATLKVESLPEDEEGGNDGRRTTGSKATESLEFESTFTINKQAGLVNVYATEREHKQVEQYLKLLRTAVTAQVLIEAKVLEVSLNDHYQTGINWRLVDGGDLALNFFSTATPAALAGVGPGSTNAFSAEDPATFILGSAGDDAQALLMALSQFGTVKALASPRLTVLNNQSAVLNVATNHVYFEVNIDTTTDEGVTQVDIDSDIRNVPEGVLVNVQPSINLDNNTIALAVRPTVTRLVGDGVQDPAVAFVAESAGIDIDSRIPEVNVQEIDSVIQVNSGQPIVMGGLLQDRTQNDDGGVPVLSEIPLAGSLFKTHGDTVSKTELVIFLKATILERPEDTIHNTDKDLYRTFSGDRRPFKL